MSRLTIPSLSVAAGLFLLALMVPGPLAHATHVQELIEQRSANTRVWEVTHLPVAGTDTVADTTRVGYIVEKGTGINHKSAAGRWERTNTDFVASERPGIVLEAAEQRAPVRLRQTGGYNVEYAVGGVGINLAVESIGYYNRKSNQYLPLHRIRRVAPQTAGDKALFREAFPGADVEYLNRPAAFKQNVILKDPTPYLSSLPVGASSDFLLVVATRILVEDASGILAADRSALESVVMMQRREYSFVDRDGWPVSFFAEGDAWDSREPLRRTLKVDKHILADGYEHLLLEGLPVPTLADLVFPVVIDYVLRPCPTLQGGELNAKEVWTNRNTYWVSAPLFVTAEDTLVIEPGTVVKLGSSESSDQCIWAKPVPELGRAVNLHASGTPYLPIIFTSYADDGYGEDIDTGQGGLPPEATPATGDYAAALVIECYSDGSLDSQHSAVVRDCRFRYAGVGVVDYFHAQVYNCIFQDCHIGIWNEKLTDNFQHGVATHYINNLMVDMVYFGVVCQQTEYQVILNMFNNTIDGAICAFISSAHSGIMRSGLWAWNNVITNCTQFGFSDYAWMDQQASYMMFTIQDAPGTFMEYNTFYNVGDSSACAYYGDKRDGLVLQPTDRYQDASPYEADRTANGRHYLSTTYGPINNATEIYDASQLFRLITQLTTRTTLAPLQRDVGIIDANENWIATATPDADWIWDGGYHHPPVDYIVGTNATAQNYRVYLDADVTVADGVVVAFHRPAESAIKPQIHVRDGSLNASSVENNMILFDSSYYLGTKFLNWTDSSAPGFREAGGIHFEAGGGNSVVQLSAAGLD